MSQTTTAPLPTLVPKDDVPTEHIPIDPAAAAYENHDEFVKASTTKSVRPAHWPWKKITALLDQYLADPKYDGDTRYVSLRGTDSPNGSTIPTQWVTIHCLRPGEKIQIHRHTPASTYFIIRGTGYSTINEYRIDWEDGDTFSCPSFSYHEHYNTGQENSYIYTVQDAPTYVYNRMMLFQYGHSEAFLCHKKP